MKTLTLALLCFLLPLAVASAGNEKFVTITAPGGSQSVTNRFTVLEGQSAEVIQVIGSQAFCYYSKDGFDFTAVYQAVSSPSGVGTIIAGPATFTLASQAGLNAALTLKIRPESYDPNKTVIVPPGTNQVAITMESSTNLVNWGTATNGIYGSPDVARFFRIRMDKLN
jgi:hypothetical protein